MAAPSGKTTKAPRSPIRHGAENASTWNLTCPTQSQPPVSANFTPSTPLRSFALYHFFGEKEDHDSLRDYLILRGPFNGDLASTKVEIDQHQPEIISESPSQALVNVDSDLVDEKRSLNQVHLGSTLIGIKSGTESERLKIVLYADNMEQTQAGQARKGNIKVAFIGLPHVPEFSLGYIFNTRPQVDVMTSRTIKKYKPREITRLKQEPPDANRLNQPDDLLSEEKSYRLYLSDKFWKAERNAYEVDIPIKVKKSFAWVSPAILRSSLITLDEPARVRESVLTEIATWQSTNRIEVSAPVKQQVADQFIALSSPGSDLLPEVWPSFSREVPSFNQFVRFLTSMYLYALRDTQEGKNLKPPTLLSISLLEEQEPVPSTIATITLKLKDFP